MTNPPPAPAKGLITIFSVQQSDGRYPPASVEPVVQASSHSATPTKVPISTVTGEFGRRVREQRLQLGLSQEKLADKAELHWTFVGQVERGQRNLTLHNIVKLADALQIDAGRLTTGLGAISEPGKPQS